MCACIGNRNSFVEMMLVLVDRVTTAFLNLLARFRPRNYSFADSPERAHNLCFNRSCVFHQRDQPLFSKSGQPQVGATSWFCKIPHQARLLSPTPKHSHPETPISNGLFSAPVRIPGVDAAHGRSHRDLLKVVHRLAEVPASQREERACRTAHRGDLTERRGGLGPVPEAAKGGRSAGKPVHNDGDGRGGAGGQLGAGAADDLEAGGAQRVSFILIVLVGLVVSYNGARVIYLGLHSEFTQQLRSVNFGSSDLITLTLIFGDLKASWRAT
jgi:hypothetical protein